MFCVLPACLPACLLAWLPAYLAVCLLAWLPACMCRYPTLAWIAWCSASSQRCMSWRPTQDHWPREASTTHIWTLHGMWASRCASVDSCMIPCLQIVRQPLIWRIYPVTNILLVLSRYLLNVSNLLTELEHQNCSVHLRGNVMFGDVRYAGWC